MTLRARLSITLALLGLALAAAWARRWVGLVRGVALLGRDYREVDLGQKLGFPVGFNHLTVATLPAEERYPPLVAAAKVLVVAALSARVGGGDTGERPATAASSPLRSAYRWLGTPALADPSWLGDEAMGWLRLAGPNAGWITRGGEGVVLDYRALLAGVPSAAGRFLTPCRARFTTTGTGLLLSGIDLLVDGEAVRVGPGDGPAWHLAKLHLQSADLFVHEVVSHFLWTHCHAEHVILASAKLPAGHPVRALLAPHFAFTLVANENSGRVLLGEVGVFDRLFSAGWAGTRALLSRGAAAWRFSRMVPRLDAEDRGLGDLPVYPCRDDAALLWDALATRVQRAKLPLDDATRAWAADLRRRFGADLPEVGDEGALALVVTACLFTTVRHTLVNAGQYEHFGYPPHWPSMLCRPFPGDLSLVTDDYVRASLPPPSVQLDAARATYAFSIQFNRLGPPGDDLRAVQAEIERRNATRWRPYRVAEPGRVSNSVNA